MNHQTYIDSHKFKEISGHRQFEKNVLNNLFYPEKREKLNILSVKSRWGPKEQRVGVVSSPEMGGCINVLFRPT